MLQGEVDQSSAYDRLLEQGYTEEQIASILGLAGLSSEEMDMKRQQEEADALRATPGPEGRTAGNIYQAANPMEHIGAGMKQYAGMRQSQDLEARRPEIWDEQMKRRMEYLRRGAAGAPATPAATPGAPPQVYAT